MYRLLCIVEIDDAKTLAEAAARLDRFRETVQPAAEHGVTIYRATPIDIDETAHTAA